MKKTISIILIGIFLFSVIPNLVSADNVEIQLGQSFHIGEDQRAVFEEEINDEELRVSLHLMEIFAGGFGWEDDREIVLPPSASISWFLSRGNIAMGALAREYNAGEIIDIPVGYEVTIINVIPGETDTTRYVELRVDRVNAPILVEEDNEELVPVEVGDDIHFEVIPEQEEYNFQIVREESSQAVVEKQEALGSVILKLKDYIKTTKEKVEASESISEEEKEAYIKKLNEKNEVIEKYLPEIVNIQDSEQVEVVKSKLKKEIREIKPIVEKPAIKIHKDKISRIIGKLGLLSKKLERITSSLDTEDQDKVEELNSLIESANKNIDRAQKFYKNGATDITKVKSLLKQATRDIREAFRLVREILSDMERGILYGSLETGKERIYADEVEVTEMVKEETGTEVTEMIKEEVVVVYPTDSKGEKYIENIYVELDEIFELYMGQSAKLIDDSDETQRSVIITLKDIKQGSEGSEAGINVNYYEEDNFISGESRYFYLSKTRDIGEFKYIGQGVGDYIISMTSIDEESQKAEFTIN